MALSVGAAYTNNLAEQACSNMHAMLRQTVKVGMSRNVRCGVGVIRASGTVCACRVYGLLLSLSASPASKSIKFSEAVLNRKRLGIAEGLCSCCICCFNVASVWVWPLYMGILKLLP